MSIINNKLLKDFFLYKKEHENFLEVHDLIKILNQNSVCIDKLSVFLTKFNLKKENLLYKNDSIYLDNKILKEFENRMFVISGLYVSANFIQNLFFKEFNNFDKKQGNPKIDLFKRLLIYLNIPSFYNGKHEYFNRIRAEKELNPLIKDFIYDTDYPFEENKLLDINNFNYFYSYVILKREFLNKNNLSFYPYSFSRISINQIQKYLKENYPERIKNSKVSWDKIYRIIEYLNIFVYKTPVFSLKSKSYTEIDKFYSSIDNEAFKIFLDFYEKTSDKEQRKLFWENSNEKLYGIKSGHTKEWQEKYEQTCIQKYGYKNPFMSPIIKEKSKNTCIQKYGTPNINNLEWKKEKTRQTSLEKYEVEYSSQIPLSKEKVTQKWKDKNEEVRNFLLKEYPGFNFYSFEEVSTIVNRKCIGDIIKDAKQLGIKIYNHLEINKTSFIDNEGLNVLRDFYSPENRFSKGEYIVSKILKENNIFYIPYYWFSFCKNINPLPFDFYLPDYGVCIEFQGQQHSEPVMFINNPNSSNTHYINDPQKAFKEQLKRDNIKRTFCYENDIVLLEPDYKNSFEEIEEMIKEALNLKQNIL